jgi:geranylgeranyl diphosphate synthase type I
MLSGSQLGFKTEIDRALEDFLSEATAQLNAIDGHLTPVSSALRDFLAGGKRLRPLFAIAGYVGAGGSQKPAHLEAIYKASLSLELLQACALIHDDMMDGSDTRRGAPAIHKRFEREHQERSGVGASQAFGNAAALLLGDLALVLSTQALNQSGINDAQLRNVNPIFDAMKVELMAGEYLDMHAGSRDDVSIDDALKIAMYKSGKYTIERPLHFGGALALATPELLAVYSEYGIPLGIAFQLRDDLLGVFGDSSITGKPAGDDLLEGKRTALIAHAFSALAPNDSATLKRSFGNRAASRGEIEMMRDLVNKSGAVEFIEKIIAEKTTLALAASRDQRISPEGQELLGELAIAATKRSA